MKHSTSPPVSHSDIGGVPHRARGLKYTKAIHTNYNEPYQEQIKNTPGTERSVPGDIASRKCGFFVEYLYAFRQQATCLFSNNWSYLRETSKQVLK